jgi:DNA modification methylase
VQGTITNIPRCGSTTEGGSCGLDRLAFEILCGDVLATLQELRERPAFQVNIVVTSPPYFHKRNYGESTQEVGREDSVDAYCDRLVQVIDAVPLHPLGSVWVNVGDKRGSKHQLLRVPHKFCDAMEKAGW